MIIETPSSGIFDAAHITGWGLQGAQEVFKGAIIVKAAYDIIPAAGSSPRTLEPTLNANAKKIAYNDGGVFFDDTGIVLDASGYVLNADGTASDVKKNIDRFDFEYESDIAIEKPKTDIVVRGYISGTDDGSITVDGDVWFRRDSTVPKIGDTAQNLFGFQSRTVNPRLTEVGNLNRTATGRFILGQDKHLPNNYKLDFANFYKREVGFSTPSNRNLNHLTPGSIINVHKSINQSDAAYSFILPAYTLTARYRTYCGHGLDQAPYWRIIELGNLALDTLIVAPDDNTAILLWRSSWGWDQHPPDTYRKIQIFQVGG